MEKLEGFAYYGNDPEKMIEYCDSYLRKLKLWEVIIEERQYMIQVFKEALEAMVEKQLEGLEEVHKELE